MQSFPHRQPFTANPLAQLAVAFACGIAGAHFFPTPPSALLTLSGLAAAVALLALLRGNTQAATLLLTVAFLFAGASGAVLEKRNVSADSLKRLLDEGTIPVGDPIELIGVLESQPEPAPESFYLILRVERLRFRGAERNTSGVVTLLLPASGKRNDHVYEQLELRYGARIRAMTALKRTDNFRNPGVASFTEYLDRRGYDATGVIKTPLLIERLDDERVLLPLAWLYDWRQRLQEQINSQFAAETAAVLNASLLGNRYFLSHATAERFRAGGTFHVLVISGLHISFIGGLAFTLARRLTKRRVWQFLLSTTVLWAYAVAVGAEASVMRAALMFTIIAVAPLVARHGGSLNALGATALMLLAWRPGDLFDPSFQLTFLSVTAIVVLAWPLLQRVREIGSWRPTRAQPYPPTCSPWLRSLAEALFWSEKNWKRELAQLNYDYKLFKAPLATKLERYRLQSFVRYAFAALVVSTCVQVTLLPLLIVYFHRVSVSALLLNIGVSVIMAGLTFTAICAMLLGQLSNTLAVPLIGLTNTLDWLMVHSVDPFARFGVASLRVPEYSGWSAAVYGLFYVPLLILALVLSRWNPLEHPRASHRKGRRERFIGQLGMVAQVGALIIVLAHPRSAPKANGKFHIDFLDVGQGDAALVTMPNGTTLLIDGGGRPLILNNVKSKQGADHVDSFERDSRSIGEAVVSEFLWWKGLDRVDYLLATHADADHIAGLNDVARNFSVGAALVARTPANDPEYAEFSQTLAAEGIGISLLAAGDVLQFGSVNASVLWPMASKNAVAPSRNNDSVVLRLQFGERKILVTGDIENGAETALVKRGEELRCDLVKVAHHGSRTSSTPPFVDATGAKFAIISVGQTSIFGHPHREVVERWLAAGSQVFTTGKSGTITVTTDGRELQVVEFVRK